MYKVIVEKQCGCFKRSGQSAEKTFESKDEALVEANGMVEDFNDTFCQRHVFNVVENGNEITIKMENR